MPTHISSLYALAKSFQKAFIQQQYAVKHILKNNTHLLQYYYCSRAKDWLQMVKPDTNHYQKTWLTLSNITCSDNIHVIDTNNTQFGTRSKFGIAVLTWMPGQMTDIHNHPKYGCIMMPLQGKLTEERFIDIPTLQNKFWSGQKNIITPGQVTYIDNDLACHRVSNAGNDIAVSLHVYSPGPY